MTGGAGINGGRAARYVLLPQILPRIGRLFTSGLASLPYFIITVFNTVGIIPNGHPYLLRENHGRYSIFRALAEAANHVTFDRKNIDKVTFFILILAGFVMLLLQFVLCVVALIALPAYAQDGESSGDFFGNQNPNTDIAFRLLDMVFGVPGIFTTDAKTTSFHKALHALFEFYSYGLLLIGVFIIIYMVVRIVLETAQSGTPFGERFSGAWAPVRLILFFGLLLPTPNGINLAQYVVLNAARLGSNVATNGWLTFDRTTKTPYMTASQLTAKPNLPNLEPFMSYMILARTCSWAEGRINGHDIKPYAVFEPGSGGSFSLENSSLSFPDLVRLSGGGTVFIRFGEKAKKEGEYKDELGAVFPYCGELAIPIVDQAQPGAAFMQQAYIDQIRCLWNGRPGQQTECTSVDFSDLGRDFTSRYSVTLPAAPYPDMTPYIGDSQRTQFMINLNRDMGNALDGAVEKQIEKGDWSNDAALKMGWAGAGIWFNKIAEQNGALTSAAYATPDVRKMPYVMELIYKRKMQEDPSTPVEEAYTPITSKGVVSFDTPQQRDIAVILNQVYQYYGSDNASAYFKNVPASRGYETTGNIIIDTMNMVMGTKGLFDMCKNTDVHPLAQLSSLGKGLVDHSIRGFGVAAGIGVGGGILSLLSKQNFSATIQSATKFFMTFAGIGLVLGFVLFYVLPFLPFIYFFFAVMTWVKSIFEAMVGLPLWALAHLRIDGEGMPGDAAESGYFYILEIFLRPICIIIAFLGSIIIFAAMVKVLNQIFYLVLSNLSGHSIDVGSTGCFNQGALGSTGAGTEAEYKRGALDEFFYTAVYAIIVYMIGLPCFKLVDLIPDNIMRWMGSGIQSFGSQDGDPAENLMSYVTAGAGLAGKKLNDAVGKGFGFSS